MGRIPSLKQRPCQRLAVVIAAGDVFRRVTGSATDETLDQIGATIPSLRLGRIGPEYAGPEIDQIPGGGCRTTNVEREFQLVRSNLVAHRLEGAEIGPDRGRVLAS